MKFYKYQGAGNDFVLLDQRENTYIKRGDVSLIKTICDRRFGIGADGLMLLQLKEGYDFEMIYFNSDGNESTMCGNGGRCIAAFAQRLGIIRSEGKFIAIDGDHDVIVNDTGEYVELKMKDVNQVELFLGDYLLDTGSPHYVQFVENLEEVDIYSAGKAIRNSDRFLKEGVNVNFVENENNTLRIGTYERGVEAETLACGTGVTAAALAFQKYNNREMPSIKVTAKGGDLEVKSEMIYDGFKNIWLCGPAKFVFEGDYIQRDK
jgi:diaminopimelate epimerase